MAKNKNQSSFDLMYKLTNIRLETLEQYMRSYFATFERLHPFETLDELMKAIGLMEKIKVFIEYPDHEYSKDQEMKTHYWVQLRKMYKVEK